MPQKMRVDSNGPVVCCHALIFLPELSSLALSFYLHKKLSLKAIVTIFVRSYIPVKLKNLIRA